MPCEAIYKLDENCNICQVPTINFHFMRKTNKKEDINVKWEENDKHSFYFFYNCKPRKCGVNL